MFYSAFCILVCSNLTADGTPFRFGKDSNGNYGYIITGKDGADSVIPFKKGGGISKTSDVIFIAQAVTGRDSYTITATVPSKGNYYVIAYAARSQDTLSINVTNGNYEASYSGTSGWTANNRGIYQATAAGNISAYYRGLVTHEKSGETSYPATCMLIVIPMS